MQETAGCHLIIKIIYNLIHFKKKAINLCLNKINKIYEKTFNDCICNYLNGL